MPPPTPVVQSFLIADQVFRQAETGKWCIIGVFNGIWARKFPVVHPSLGLYLKLSDAQGEYKISVDLHDDKDQCIAKLQGLTLKVPDRLADVDVGLQGYNLPLPNPGNYFLKVFFNGEMATKDIRFKASVLEDPNA